jgi:hypothetical protein
MRPALRVPYAPRASLHAHDAQGLDASIQEGGVNLSGGQRQLLCMVRAAGGGAVSQSDSPARRRAHSCAIDTSLT